MAEIVENAGAKSVEGRYSVESDVLGSVRIAKERLLGINTTRALVNFSSCGAPIGRYPDFVRALAQIKKAAALVNERGGTLGGDVASAIVRACDEIIASGTHADLLVPILEGSGGTSSNMNMNEVIANRALQIAGSEPGRYDVIHPNDHVNLGQSSNDVYPAAIKLAAYAMSGPLLEVLDRLSVALRRKSAELAGVLRVGRTCMQPAQPMFLGQAFGGYANAVERARSSLAERRAALLVLPLGATAIGTGLGSSAYYRKNICPVLSEMLGLEVRQARDFFDGLQNADQIARFSSELRACAQIVGKIGADLVILGSGTSGLGEIRLPPAQAGSSIMPGKINPVMPMLVHQMAFVVHGNDATVALAAQSGQLEINHYEGAMARAVFDSLEKMTAAYGPFCDRCIEELAADEQRSYANLLASPAIATVFVEQLGYAKTSRIVRAAERDGRTFIAAAIAEGLLAEESVKDILQRAAEQPE